MSPHHYYNKVLRVVKELLDDEELSGEEKVRILGVIL